ncbi:hypothetical protein ACQEV2_42355 [Streptomyces sp. CA-251387]|uniref:hypothetical protein n=1 Tax=Streptomyces sp. CA-251387 TaxID=3240064 RepID=UPI003D8A5D4F
MAQASPHLPPLLRLPVRTPQAALHALPTWPTEPSPVSLFGVPAGEDAERRFDLTRLRRIHTVDDTAEPTP